MLSNIFGVFAVMAMMLGVNILFDNRRMTKYNFYFFLLCLTSGMWSLGYSIMLRMDNFLYASYARMLASFGITMYVPVLYVILMCMIFKDTGKYVKVTSLVSLVCSLVCFVLLMQPGNAEFTKASFGTTYFLNNTIGRKLYVIYAAVTLTVLISSVVCWLKISKYKREKAMGRILLVAAIIFISGSYFDAFRPIAGEYLFPSSCFAQFMAVLILYFVTRRYNTFELSYRNIASYMYAAVHTPVLVFNPDNVVVLANDSAAKFFERGRSELLKMNLKELFRFEDESKRLLDELIKKEYSVKAVANNKDAVCRLDISDIFDSYEELMCRICIVNDITQEIENIKEMEKSKEEAENANKAKSLFLANMSHEIRTPLNAIIGMSEIMMRDELSPKQKNNISSIKNSGLGLLTIINDVLDLSKIESGKLDIVEDEYGLYSVLYDTANIISIRLNDKNVKFLMYVQPNIPAMLIGDIVRIKQILINILGNAVKFTDEGYIKLDVKYTYIDNERIKLYLEVTDTGIGIRQEDIHKIFSAYSQVNSKQTQNVQGTGLGLSICKNLAEMMDGNISVESTYGKGTTFKVEIVQKCATSKNALVKRNNSLENPIIVLEENFIVREHLREVFESMNITATICESEKEFINNLLAMKTKYRYIISHQYISDNAMKTLKMYCKSTNAKMVHIYGKIQLQNEIFDYNLFLPVIMPQLSMLLEEGKINTDEYVRKNEEIKIIQKSNARILIVDDNRVNLQVAEGLMLPYNMKIECALSGEEAIEKVLKTDFDLIFMDHMMPGMDGTETMQIIRTLENGKFRELPVIALTANALSDARKMFMEVGYQDFLAKPIDINQLNIILNKWLHESESIDTSYIGVDKIMKENNINKDTIINVDKGIEMVGGVKEVYYDILHTYQEELQEHLEKIDEAFENDLKQFITMVHGIKSTSLSMGAEAFGLKAKDLEFAGKDGKIDYIKEKLPSFKEDAKEVIEYISKMDF